MLVRACGMNSQEPSLNSLSTRSSGHPLGHGSKTGSQRSGRCRHDLRTLAGDRRQSAGLVVPA